MRPVVEVSHFAHACATFAPPESEDAVGPVKEMIWPILMVDPLRFALVAVGLAALLLEQAVASDSAASPATTRVPVRRGRDFVIIVFDSLCRWVPLDEKCRALTLGLPLSAAHEPSVKFNKLDCSARTIVSSERRVQRFVEMQPSGPLNMRVEC